MTDRTSPPTDPGLLRDVGRWPIVALTINGIIGAGIFGLPSKVDALAGPWGLLAFVACAVVVASIALCFAEVSSRFTHTGGPYLYTHHAFGATAGFTIGWLMWLTRVTAMAVISNVMASYLAYFWPPAAGGWGRAAAMSVVVISLTVINFVGVKQAATAAMVFTIGKLVPLLVFVGVGLFFIDPKAFVGTPPPSTSSFTQAVLLAVYAFSGFESAVVAAGEMQDPRRDLPFALFLSLAVAALLYVLIQVVCIGTLPGLEASDRPLADAGVRFMGPIGASFIAAGALVSTTGTLCASVLIGPRVLFAMAERRQMPGFFGSVHDRFHTPHIAILINAAVGLALSISGTFTYLLGLNVIARLATYVSTSAALPVLRRR